MQEKDEAGTRKKIDDAIDTRPIPKSEFMDTSTDARHWTRQGHVVRKGVEFPFALLENVNHTSKCSLIYETRNKDASRTSRHLIRCAGRG